MAPLSKLCGYATEHRRASSPVAPLQSRVPLGGSTNIDDRGTQSADIDLIYEKGLFIDFDYTANSHTGMQFRRKDRGSRTRTT